jgi:cellulose synthase/poly-beta-1,6-N-acetylglucosamine synthase-like glycosyltransferase
MFELLIYTFFALNTLYVITLAVAGHFYKKKKVPSATHFKKIAILIPSYKEDNVILHTTKELLALNYPSSAFDVIIIADSLQPKTIENLRTTRAIVLPVSFELSMKSRSLNYAFTKIDDQYDIAIIADADNILAKNFLREINDLFYAGYTIIQAQRVAKNLNTPMAMLDGVSEAINNHLFRQGSNALGLSSALIGSGMSFPFSLLKNIFSKIDSPVEDKILQLAIAEQGHSIVYQKGILVYDEKVESPEAYKNQRRRWIAGQYDVLRKNFIKGFSLLFRGNINYFNLAICHNIFPSRINSLISLALLSAVFSLAYQNYEISIRWITITLLYIFALSLAIPRILYTKQLFKSLLIMPLVIIKTVQAIILARNANKTFIHTEHKQSKIDSTFLQK